MKMKFPILLFLLTTLTVITSCDTSTEKKETQAEATTSEDADTCNYDFTIKVNPEQLKLSNLTNLNVDLTNGSIKVEKGEVILKRQQLEALPKEVFDYNCFHTLLLGTNSFSKFPNEVLEIEKLKKVDLSENKITKFPSIAEETDLQTLNLNGNRITSIAGADLLKFKNLKNLFLKDNAKLADLPEEIQQMKNLKSLDLRGTKLGKSYTKIRKLMKEMPNTKVFYR